MSQPLFASLEHCSFIFSSCPLISSSCSLMPTLEEILLFSNREILLLGPISILLPSLLEKETHKSIIIWVLSCTRDLLTTSLSLTWEEILSCFFVCGHTDLGVDFFHFLTVKFCSACLCPSCCPSYCWRKKSKLKKSILFLFSSKSNGR